MTYSVFDLIKDLEETNPEMDWTKPEYGLMPKAARTLKRFLICRREYGKDSLGNPLFCHNEAIDDAIECFIRSEGAIFVDGKPVENFGVSTRAMALAIQAYIDKIAEGEL